MDGDGGLRRAEAAAAVVIAGRMQGAKMQDVGPPLLILEQDAFDIGADPVIVADGPAIRARHDFDPLGPQREQVDRIAARILHHLDVGIAVQQQVDRQHIEQRLAAGIGRHQLADGLAFHDERRAADGFGNDADGALRHRIALERGDDGFAVIVALPAGNGAERHGPRRDISLGQRHAAAAAALEGSGQAVEKRHGSVLCVRGVPPVRR